jgi:hypothetical protein
MKMRSTALLACLAVGFSGCGLQTYSTRVQETGPDAFSVAAEDLNPSIAKQSAIGRAQMHCGNQSRVMLMTDQSARTAGDQNVYEVAFRCLAKGDPELARAAPPK